ncbi:MAG: site-specific integrase [Bacteroidales bacterium]|nr:site-specific integrase [Bacteroidales bacterium]
MRVTALIRKSTKKDTANVKSTVYFRVRDGQTDFKAASELTINPNYWSPERQGYKPRVSLVADKVRADFDRSVQEISLLITKEYYIGADSEWLKKLIFAYHHPNAYRMSGKECVNVSLIYWTNKYLNQHFPSGTQRRTYLSLVGMIERFERYQHRVGKKAKYHLCVDTMTGDDLRMFEHYITNEATYMERYPQLYKDVEKTVTKGERKGNTLACLMGRLRTAFKWSIKQGATTNNPFDRYDMPKVIYGTPYFLTLEERNLIYELDLTDNPVLAVYRDMFCFQCLIGCRHGDLIRLTLNNVIDGYIEYVPAKTREKTGRMVRVPLNEKAKTLLERFKARGTRTLFPHISLGLYNSYIRELLVKADITRVVSVIDPKTHEEVQHRICDIASSHMARRTFVGNLYKQVKDPNLIGSMSGHTEGSRAFARYRTIDDDMKIELVNLIN